MKGKKVIKGIAKTTGKYSLKALGKGMELVDRGVIKTIDALVKNPQIQKIATGAGLLAAGVMIPTVGVGMIGSIGAKYMIDKTLLSNNKGILEEMNDILLMGNTVTKNVSNKILSPVLNKSDKGMKNLGRNYQNKIDDIFR